MGRVFSNSSVILCLTMFWIESPNEGDAVALDAGCETGLLLLAERMIAGAKTTDTMASTRSKAAMIKTASPTRAIALRVGVPGAFVCRTPVTQAGGAGFPIVSA